MSDFGGFPPTNSKCIHRAIRIPDRSPRSHSLKTRFRLLTDIVFVWTEALASATTTSTLARRLMPNNSQLAFLRLRPIFSALNMHSTSHSLPHRGSGFSRYKTRLQRGLLFPASASTPSICSPSVCLNAIASSIFSAFSTSYISPISLIDRTRKPAPPLNHVSPFCIRRFANWRPPGHPVTDHLLKHRS